MHHEHSDTPVPAENALSRNIDIETCESGGTVKIIASIEDPAVKALLDHLEEYSPNTRHARLTTGRTRITPSDSSGPDGLGASPHPLGTDAESFMTAAEELSCRRQTNTEDAAKIAA